MTTNSSIPNQATNSVIKTGNSLAVVVPAKFSHQLGIQAGDQVSLKVSQKKGQITYTFLNIRQLSLV
jgi:antitoxin component of MazEF toxin-antitoxin module